MSQDHDPESHDKHSKRPCHAGCEPRYQCCSGSNPARCQRAFYDGSHDWLRGPVPFAADRLSAE